MNINLPLVKSDSTEINYSNHDGYTFWYKFNPKENGKIDYQVAAVLPGASFDVKIFEYDGGIFCKQMVKEVIEPITQSSRGTVKIKKQYYYYLGISSKSTNCGHDILLTQNKFTYHLRSTEIGSECSKLNDYSRPVAKKTEENKDKIIVGGVQLSGKVFNSVTKGMINADLRFEEKSTDYEVQTIAYRLKGFEVDLERKTYHLKVYSMGYFPLDTMINVKNEIELSFYLKPVEKGEKFIIDNIYFYPNTFACKPESQQALEALKDYMLENKKVKIEIQGHTNGNKDVKRVKNNPRTGEEWNFEGSAKDLSKLRADKLKEYLINQGVSKKRILTVGMGGDEMIVPDPKDMKEAAKNIRVEIKILSD